MYMVYRYTRAREVCNIISVFVRDQQENVCRLVCRAKYRYTSPHCSVFEKVIDRNIGLKDTFYFYFFTVVLQILLRTLVGVHTIHAYYIYILPCVYIMFYCSCPHSLADDTFYARILSRNTIGIAFYNSAAESKQTYLNTRRRFLI